MDVRELRYFVAVAEELNVSRAAARIGIAQPALSRAIQRLERQLGVPLFDRAARAMTLTAAGSVLLGEGRKAVRAMEAAERRTRRAGAAEPRLVVAHKPGGDAGLLPEVLRAYACRDGLPPAEVTVTGPGGPLEALRTGIADVAIVPVLADLAGLEHEPLLDDGWVAVLPKEHPLGTFEALDTVVLSGEPMVRWVGGDDAAQEWPGGTAPAGPPVHNTEQLFEVVSLGQALALLPSTLAESRGHDGVVYRPVVDLPPLTIAVVWPAGCRSRAVAGFVAAAVDRAALSRAPGSMDP